MILISLELKNFKKYKSFFVEFGEGLTGIIGKNGSGKSTIFEAILYALYGELKGNKFKEIIKHSKASSKESMVVELVFELESKTYKIIRELRGKNLTPKASFYENEELISTGVKDVTQSVSRLIKMTKEAFLSTIFASQKELTALSNLSSDNRKKMIRKLLGLKKIDTIEEKLTQTIRDLNKEIKAYDNILLKDEEIKQKNDKIKSYENEIAQNTKEIEQISKNLKIQETKQKDLSKKLEELDNTKQELNSLENKLNLANNTKKQKLEYKTKQEAELEAISKKEKELETLLPKLQEHKALEDSIKHQNQLKTEFIKKQNLLEQKLKLQEEENLLSKEIKSFEEKLKTLPVILKELEELQQLSKKKEECLSQLKQKEKELNSIISEANSLIKDTNKKIKKIKELGKESSCPICTRALLDEYDNVLSSLEKTVESITKDKLKNTQEELKNLEENILNLQKEIEKLQAQQNDKSQEKATLLANQKELEKLQNKHTKKMKEITCNKEELEALKDVEYDENKHQEILEKFEKSKKIYENILKLQTYVKRKDELLESVRTLDKEIKEAQDLSITYQEKIKNISYDSKIHVKTKEEFENILKEKDLLKSNIHKIELENSKLVSEVKAIKENLKTNQKHKEKIAQKQNDLIQYEKIKLNLSNFKTVINSKISPRISQIASQMFEKITHGKYQMVEVSDEFDFFIYDDGEKYPIERFSGGEIDLANLVLRIAISKTLSELNGINSIGFLAFDEIFGSQDEQRRLEILEAFHTIKEQYRQIFLISHEIEIKEMFEKILEIK